MRRQAPWLAGDVADGSWDGAVHLGTVAFEGRHFSSSHHCCLCLLSVMMLLYCTRPYVCKSVFALMISVIYSFSKLGLATAYDMSSPLNGANATDREIWRGRIVLQRTNSIIVCRLFSVLFPRTAATAGASSSSD